MYIKIKYIKFFLLLSACVSLAGFNYFTYVKADNTTIIDSDDDDLSDSEEKLYGTDLNNPDSDDDGYSDGVEVKSGYDPTKPAPGDKIATIASSRTLAKDTDVENDTNLSATEEFSQDLDALIKSKDNQSISTSDIQSFVDEKLVEKSGPTLSFDTLPEVDPSQLKILDQTYASLNEAGRKEKIQQDAIKYLYEILYLLVSNAPQTIATPSDLKAFQEDFTNRLSDLSDSDNIAYFSDLGNRIDIFSQQLSAITVPSTMVDLHVKFFRLIKGFLTLRAMPAVNSDDPFGNMLTMTKAKELTELAASFFTNDLASYFNQINN